MLCELFRNPEAKTPSIHARTTDSNLKWHWSAGKSIPSPVPRSDSGACRQEACITSEPPGMKKKTVIRIKSQWRKNYTARKERKAAGQNLCSEPSGWRCLRPCHRDLEKRDARGEQCMRASGGLDASRAAAGHRREWGCGTAQRNHKCVRQQGGAVYQVVRRAHSLHRLQGGGIEKEICPETRARQPRSRAMRPAKS